MARMDGDTALCSQEETLPFTHPGRHNPLPRVWGLPNHPAAYPKLAEAHADGRAL